MNPLSAAPRRTVRHPAAATALRNCVLLADGNGGKNVPYQAARAAGCRTDVLSEAMLPEIRTIAMLPQNATRLPDTVRTGLPMKPTGLPPASSCWPPARSTWTRQPSR